MTIEFDLPELGEGVDSGEVSRVYVAVGDTIEADDNVLELESEKAVMDLPCPHAGRIVEVHVSQGDIVEVGEKLLTIEPPESDGDGDGRAREPGDEEDEERQETGHGDGDEEREPGDEQGKERDGDGDAAQPGDDEDIVAAVIAENREQDAKPQRDAGGTGGRQAGSSAPAGPATRRLARELDVDLGALKPPEGEAILQEDVVRAYLEQRATPEPGSGAKLPDFAAFGAVERERLGEVRRTAGRRLARSWRTIPHVTQHGSADITELDAERRRYQQSAGDEVPRITLTAIAVSAVCGVLEELPRFNASLDSAANEIVLKRYYNIGVAVATERGLVVPVVHDADRKSIRAIAAEIAELADRARRRNLSKEHLEGASFTISNQGGIGGGHFTPIIPWPQAGILGLGRAITAPRIVDGKAAARLVLPLSLSYDHRVADGADAARFVERFAAVLSAPSKLLMEA